MTLWLEIEEQRAKNKSLDTYMAVIKARQSKKTLYQALRVYYRWAKEKGFAKTYDELLKGTVDELEQRVTEYIKYLNPLTSRSVLNNRYYAVKTFYVLNKVRLEWELLKRFKDAQRPDRQTRAYKKKEVERMLVWAKKHQDIELEFLILVLASSGMRIGALLVEDTDTAIEAGEKPLPIMRLGDLKWLDTHRLFALRVYTGHPEQYITFMSAQASECAQRYWTWLSKKHKMEQTPQTYIFYNKQNPELPVPVRTLEKRLLACKEAVGIKDKQDKTGVQVKAAHGFRAYVETVAFVECGLDVRKARLLLGHSLEGQDDSYFRPTVEALLVGNEVSKGYIYAKPALEFQY